MFSLDQYLSSFLDWEKQLHRAGAADFSLTRVERLLHAFGRPDDRLKFVHIAGSKGKGSTAVFLANILRAAGYRVGLYTSPHLFDISERIRVLEPGRVPAAAEVFEGAVDREELSERARYYQDPVDRLRFADQVPVTYFEYLTALAMSYFERREVQVVVLETGLGGRLDATNVVETMGCGITPIGLEHTAILGDTLAAIAAEKAGVIKSPCQKVVLAPQPAQAREVLIARCQHFGIIPTEVGRDMGMNIRRITPAGCYFDLEGRRKYRDIHIGLTGQHQVLNAAMATAMAEDLEMYGYLLDEEAVVNGLAAARWPARFEVFPGTPTVILDCAHTPESAAALASTFAAVFPDRQAVVVFGVSSDKDITGVARALERIVARAILTAADNPRSVKGPDLVARGVFASVCPEVVAGVVAAVDRAIGLAGPEGIVVVCGSVYMCAEARRHVAV